MGNREHIHMPRNAGEVIADAVASGIGSWRFIIAQASLLGLWIVLNSVALITHWDPAPFILLNLCLSFQAAFTGPLVMLAQNRQAAKDRLRDDHEAEEVDQLFAINQRQITILDQQSEILELLRPERPAPTVTRDAKGRFVRRSA